MSLLDDLDAAVIDLRADPDETYEVAISVALAADRYSGVASADALLASSIRDAFGTWVERIHSYGGPKGNLADAEAAHRDITTALEDWTGSGREDLTAFAERWRDRVGHVDTAWMNEEVSPLVR